NLLSGSGQLLRGTDTLADAGLQLGDALTFQIRQVAVAASSTAFAAILGDGSVATWGQASAGG
ncbi:ppsA, partial [Symbiodinium necroappetens]